MKTNNIITAFTNAYGTHGCSFRILDGENIQVTYRDRLQATLTVNNPVPAENDDGQTFGDEILDDPLTAASTMMLLGIIGSQETYGLFDDRTYVVTTHCDCDASVSREEKLGITWAYAALVVLAALYHGKPFDLSKSYNLMWQPVLEHV